MEERKLIDNLIKQKHFTIVNHTDKTYMNNGLFSLAPIEKNGVWKLRWCSTWTDDFKITFQKINTIKPKKNINKNEKVLKLDTWGRGIYSEAVFLFSLDGGKKKIFFGSYEDTYKPVWKDDSKECKRYFVRFDVHPVWQKKELTIHIYKDRIVFSDPKIKEVKRLRLSYDEYEDPYALELVDDCLNKE